MKLVSTQVYIYEEEDEEPEEGLGEQQADMSGHPCAYIKTCIFYIENVYKVLEGNARAYITQNVYKAVFHVDSQYKTTACMTM